MIRAKQTNWRNEMSQSHECFYNFIKVLTSPSSQEGYGYNIQKFMKFMVAKGHVENTEDFEGALNFDGKELTALLQSYVNHLEMKGMCDISVQTILTSPELFYEMNLKIWHKKVVRKSIRKNPNRIQGGGVAATNEDLLLMVNYTTSLRNKAIILMMGSTGIRPGGFVDPVLKMKHLISLPHPDHKMSMPNYAYGIKVYDDSQEGYWTFLTPEARMALDDYIASRKRKGEKITQDTPLFGINYSHHKTKINYLTDDNVKWIIKRIIIGSKVPRVKISARKYDKAGLYMFRKRFNGILKMDNAVNSNIAEKLMAHKNGLDGTYLKPTMDQCFAEFVKAIPALTVNPAQRDQAKIEMLEKDVSKVEIMHTELMENQAKIRRMEEELKFMKIKNGYAN